jgi:hypothetical protein
MAAQDLPTHGVTISRPMKPQAPDPNLRIPYSDMISSGRYDMKDVIQPTYDEINKKYGLNEKQE